MPIVEKDPWRDQYFQGLACPPGTVIPTDDMTAWVLFPEHRWIYNKLLICETQGIEGAPHGVNPSPAMFPVFSKPIYNMSGMGLGSRVIHTQKELDAEPMPGCMWMRLLDGEHVSTDAAVVNGRALWWRHSVGKPAPGGMFDYWTVMAEPRPEIEEYCDAWLEKNLAGYTGCINFETIGARIIEAHLRFADQWPDLYGKGWLEAMVRLYAEGKWDYPDDDRRTGYSVVLFGEHGPQYKKPHEHFVNYLKRDPDVSSVQLTFHEDLPPRAHSMPPGGFRLAIVNCWDLNAGIKAREKLSLWFAETLTVGA
jgi:hypothetical protein